jgi:hypothetical protein
MKSAIALLCRRRFKLLLRTYVNSVHGNLQFDIPSMSLDNGTELLVASWIRTWTCVWTIGTQQRRGQGYAALAHPGTAALPVLGRS